MCKESLLFPQSLGAESPSPEMAVAAEVTAAQGEYFQPGNEMRQATAIANLSLFSKSAL